MQSLNPGFLKTDLQRHVSGIQGVILNLLLRPPIHGAYTELFAGLSPDITLKKTGAWSTSQIHLVLHCADLVYFSHTLGPIRYSEEGYRGLWKG